MIDDAGDIQAWLKEKQEEEERARVVQLKQQQERLAILRQQQREQQQAQLRANDLQEHHKALAREYGLRVCMPIQAQPVWICACVVPGYSDSSQGEDDEEVIECVACDKFFRSEKSCASF